MGRGTDSFRCKKAPKPTSSDGADGNYVLCAGHTGPLLFCFFIVLAGGRGGWFGGFRIKQQGETRLCLVSDKIGAGSWSVVSCLVDIHSQLLRGY